MGYRIVVKGASGSGKTTLAARLATAVGAPHVELDAIHHGPGWAAPPLEEFRSHVERLTAGESWVVDGNYDLKLGDMVLRRADLVVWLDPPLRTILARLYRRTKTRIRDDVELWNGNRESWRGALLGRDSLFVWAIRTHFRHRLKLRRWAHAAGVPLVRLRSDDDVERWLETLPQTSTTTGRIIGRRPVRS
ncbi:MAG TPA: hypothetical protein VH306_01405 [Gaiellaceae bacterium]|jgi:adenylate kinase family enzyme